MVASSFSTVETICSLMVSASAWLFASAVRHHRMWTPIALTMIDARTRPEIAKRMRIRMSGGTSSCMYREKRHRCKANVLASAMLALAKIGQPRGPLDDLTWRFHRGTPTACGYPRAAIQESILMRHDVIK